jgi:hypothetical protein
MLRRSRPDRTSIYHLKRFWDELVQGGPATPEPTALDPALAATVRQLHARDDAPAADPTFAARLLEDLMDAPHVARLPRTTPIDPAAGWFGPTNGRTAPLPSRWPIRPRGRAHRWGFAQVATALLVLLTLALGYLALGPGLPGADRPDTLPAAVPPAATPMPTETIEETLFSVTLPAEVLPHGDKITASFHDVSIPAGFTTSWEAARGACCPGIRVDYVRVGSYTARADGPAQVLRAGGAGTPETVPAGTDILLGPGDAMFFPNETAVEYAFAEAIPVELLVGLLFDASTGHYEEAPLPGGWRQNSAALFFDQSIPPGPATLRLRRVELAADAALSPPPGVLQYGVLTPERAAGTPTPRDVGALDDGTIRNFGSGAVIVYVLTLEPTGDSAGSPVAGSPTP